MFTPDCPELAARTGAEAGGALLQYVAGPALIGALALILLVSAGKVWRHPEDT